MQKRDFEGAETSSKFGACPTLLLKTLFSKFADYQKQKLFSQSDFNKDNLLKSIHDRDRVLSLSSIILCGKFTTWVPFR